MLQKNETEKLLHNSGLYILDDQGTMGLTNIHDAKMNYEKITYAL